MVQMALHINNIVVTLNVFNLDVHTNYKGTTTNNSLGDVQHFEFGHTY